MGVGGWRGGGGGCRWVEGGGEVVEGVGRRKAVPRKTHHTTSTFSFPTRGHTLAISVVGFPQARISGVPLTGERNTMARRQVKHSLSEICEGACLSVSPSDSAARAWSGIWGQDPDERQAIARS